MNEFRLKVNPNLFIDFRNFISFKTKGILVKKLLIFFWQEQKSLIWLNIKIESYENGQKNLLKESFIREQG
jgi:hypothetical protein